MFPLLKKKKNLMSTSGASSINKSFPFDIKIDVVQHNTNIYIYMAYQVRMIFIVINENY